MKYIYDFGLCNDASKEKQVDKDTLTATATVSDGDGASYPARLGPQVTLVVVGDAVGAAHWVKVGGAVGALTHGPPLPLHAHPAVLTLVSGARTFFSCNDRGDWQGEDNP